LVLTDHLFIPSRVVLETHLCRDIPGLLIDRHMMEQVLMNLILNGVQAMKTGGILTIRTFIKEGCCFVEVKDTGCGIPASVLPRIFDPFFTTKNEGEGTGLGLSVSMGIIERHGGKISVDSEVGRGTKFTLSLPLAKDRYAIGKLS
jgi:signal transduction histidine kinase